MIHSLCVASVFLFPLQTHLSPFSSFFLVFILKYIICSCPPAFLCPPSISPSDRQTELRLLLGL